MFMYMYIDVHKQLPSDLVLFQHIFTVNKALLEGQPLRMKRVELPLGLIEHNKHILSIMNHAV